jgi:metallophosphoesterase (TIGR00282 family)
MRILMIGDIVGKPGRSIIQRSLGALRQRERLELVIANAENAVHGSGITPEIYRDLIAAGVDCITLGDHIYRRKEISPILDSESNIIKPANFPESAPGRPWTIIQAAGGTPVCIFCLLGRVYMRPVDCPFSAADRVLAEIPDDVKIRIVDIHAEATSDKQLMGRYLDGRVSAVLGTHTHVATADQQILPGGTAFQCDVGMTGPHDSIIGRRIDRVLETTLTFHPTTFQVAKGDVQINGAIVEVERDTGRARDVRRLRAISQDDGEVSVQLA